MTGGPYTRGEIGEIALEGLQKVGLVPLVADGSQSQRNQRFGRESQFRSSKYRYMYLFTRGTYRYLVLGQAQLCAQAGPDCQTPEDLLHLVPKISQR